MIVWEAREYKGGVIVQQILITSDEYGSTVLKILFEKRFNEEDRIYEKNGEFYIHPPEYYLKHYLNP